MLNLYIIEEYFHVERSTVSNWRKRGMPKRYLLTFIDLEKLMKNHQISLNYLKEFIK